MSIFLDWLTGVLLALLIIALVPVALDALVSLIDFVLDLRDERRRR